MATFCLVIGLMIWTKFAVNAQRCKGLYDEDDNPISPLGVCYQTSNYGSGEIVCNDDGDVVLNIYGTDDCSLVSSEQDFDLFSYDNVTCDGQRCPYALIRYLLKSMYIYVYIYCI